MLAASDGSEVAMRGLTGADDTDLAEPADLSRVETPLGTAIRSLRHYRQQSGPGLLAAVAYGWHLPEHGVDILLSTAPDEPAALRAAEADLHARVLLPAGVGHDS